MTAVVRAQQGAPPQRLQLQRDGSRRDVDHPQAQRQQVARPFAQAAVIEAGAQGLPAGTNIPQQTWLFDPRTQRFVDAPDTLQGITSPEFDKKFKTIVSQWRNGCCEHGVTTYRWDGGRLEETASASSVQLPVLVGQKILYCYTIPEYRDGRIEFPDRVEQVGDRLTLTFEDFSGCDTAGMSTSPPDIAVWKRDAAGELKVVRTERTQWKQVDTTAGRRYCPEIPYFGHGRVERKLLRDRPDEACSDTAP